MDKVKERSISLDLLRILAMFMIIILHLLSKGNALISTNQSIFTTAWIMEAFCIGAVNIYVLISGYFLCDAASFSWKKVFKIWGQVLFYSLAFLILAYILGLDVTKKDLVFSLFPVITRTNYWFVSAYLFMYIMSPFINVVINNMSKQQHLNLCLILFVIFSIVSVFLPYDSLIDNTGGCGVIWFISLYFIAAYIKKYIKKSYKRKPLVLYLVFSTCIFLATIAADFILKKIGIEVELFTRFYLYNSLFVCLSAVCIFIYFRDLKVKFTPLVNKIICFLSPLTFGVYLIHDNFFVRNTLYHNLFDLRNYSDFGILFFITIVILLALCIFFSSILIEYLRQLLYKTVNNSKIFKKLNTNLISLIKKRISKILNKCNDIFLNL